MTNLMAVSFGSALLHLDHEAVVHSVFPEAVNLNTKEKPWLFALVSADCADLPQGIRLETPAGFSFEEVLQPGQRLIYREGILEDEYRRLTIGLRRAKCWEGRLPALGASDDTARIAANWAAIWQALDERQRYTSSDLRISELFNVSLAEEPFLVQKLGILVRSLVRATRSFELPSPAEISGLVGLGPGLTPSGDDILVGFLAGLHCSAGKQGKQRAFLSKLGNMVIRLMYQTNDISRTYLYFATRGQVSSTLTSLAWAINGADSIDHLRQIAECAMRTGHSSGMDTVTGLLVGLAAWHPNICSHGF